jgi:hypothetical protein
MVETPGQDGEEDEYAAGGDGWDDYHSSAHVIMVVSQVVMSSKAITRIHAVDRGLRLLKSPAMPRISMYQQPLKTLKKMYPQYAR